MLPSSSKNYCKTRKTDKFSLADFNYKLSFEIWSDVFEGNDVNIIFNSFLNIFLWYVYASFPKSEYIIFVAKRFYEQDNRTKIAYGNKEIIDSCHTKFLGINITNTLSWKKHIDQLISKLSTACYAIRTVKPYVKLETLLMVYYAYFHSVMHYGIMFWGNLSYAIIHSFIHLFLSSITSLIGKVYRYRMCQLQILLYQYSNSPWNI
jgi:hypothetical protein